MIQRMHASYIENDTPNLAKPLSLSNCDFLNLFLRLLDSFKYTEIKFGIRFEVQNHHPKVLS